MSGMYSMRLLPVFALACAWLRAVSGQTYALRFPHVAGLSYTNAVSARGEVPTGDGGRVWANGSPLATASSGINSLVSTPGGGLVFAETAAHRVHRFHPAHGVSLLAGSRSALSGYIGDGGAATQALLNKPFDVACDAAGSSVWIADRDNHVIRRVDPYGIIHTVAGTGIQGFSG
ncbi:hypothetical protein EON68_02020, partial [archaeon]